MMSANSLRIRVLLGLALAAGLAGRPAAAPKSPLPPPPVWQDADYPKYTADTFAAFPPPPNPLTS